MSKTHLFRRIEPGELLADRESVCTRRWRPLRVDTLIHQNWSQLVGGLKCTDCLLTVYLPREELGR